MGKTYCEEAGHGWRFVPIPGVKPLPRMLNDDKEYYPLHVMLTEPDKKKKGQKHTFYYMQFMGDDGIATVRHRIESKPFLDHVLTWLENTMGWMYGANIEHIRTALEPERGKLVDIMTRRERDQIADTSHWEKSDMVWVMLE